MIYILDKIFTVGLQEQTESRSVTERLGMQGIKRVRNVPVGGLVSGRKYKVGAIRHLPDEKNFSYTFTELGTKRNIVMTFGSTSEADDFIARAAGELKTLNKIRRGIADVSVSGL